MKTKEIAYGALTAALYLLLTMAFAPISSGMIQCRIAEALCVLPYFTFSAVPGLFLGCLLSNLLTGAPLFDVAFGSLATLLAALATYVLRKRVSKYFAPLPSVLFNMAIIGAVLKYAYGVPGPYPVLCLYVGAGQALACYGLGIPLLLTMEKFYHKIS